MQIPQRYAQTSQSKKGGFGSIIVCHDKHLERDVVIKTIENKNEIRRIKDEISALLALRSKHVVQVYDVIFENEIPVGIVEEYIPGKSLCESTTPQQSTDAYLKALWQVSSGIADIHSSNIIHRDITPNNMMFDKEGIIKIFDFGLSRDAGKDAHTKGFKGTFQFSAPEQFDSSDGNIHFTPAVDIYAFGVLAGYVVDRSLPDFKFDHDRWLAIKRSIEIKLGFLPEDVKSTLLSCLNIDPLSRPKISSIRDLIAKHLLVGKHQAIAILNGAPRLLNKDNKRVQLSLPDIGSVEIVYDDFAFSVKSFSGEVYINNEQVKVDDYIPGACVVTIGSPARAHSRAFIPFNVSHPEVIL